jgi:large subunit ribosomal protein L15
MRGGSGDSGRYRHKKSRLIRNKEFVNMHYVGKKGFMSVQQRQDQGEILNLTQLSALVDKLVSEKKAQMEGQKVAVDLGQLGVRKLLGMGSISRAVSVKVDQCSESAVKKLKEAGGEVLLSTPASTPSSTPAK